MLRTDCALQLILQHIIHLIQHLFFLGSHLFLLLLVEKYMGLCINKEQGFSQLAGSVCAGKENHTANLPMSSGVGIYHIPRSVTSFLFVVSAVLRIFPPITENLEERTAAITKIPFSLKELPADQSFQNLFQLVPGKSLALMNFFFLVSDIKR